MLLPVVWAKVPIAAGMRRAGLLDYDAGAGVEVVNIGQERARQPLSGRRQAMCHVWVIYAGIWVEMIAGARGVILNGQEGLSAARWVQVFVAT